MKRVVTSLGCLLWGISWIASPVLGDDGLQFVVTLSKEARAEPVTGRVIVAVSQRGAPLRQVQPRGASFFAANVEALEPGSSVTVGADAASYPLSRIAELPPGSYRVQGMFHVYTRFQRADGHQVWLPKDRGEGQDWREAPGNIQSQPLTITIREGDFTQGRRIELTCDQVLKPISPRLHPANVQSFRIESEILSQWWGQSMQIGATLLLPVGYEEHPEVRYPVVYEHGHYSTAPPGGYMRDFEFTRKWHSEDPCARFIMVTLQHPSPYYDDSYGVDSANNGPYGRAIIEELIPEIEKRYRVLAEARARFLTGGSTGGWIALAHQIFYPDFYGGCWASYPDSVDFRAHQIVNIYRDANAYFLDSGALRVDRPARRDTLGNVLLTMRQENHYERALGDRSRSGGQWDIWDATFGPVGDDGYPKPLWNKRTGSIDRKVAEHWKDNYDLRFILQRDWKQLQPKLAGKLHLFCGTMDDYYLNLAVRHLQRFLEQADPPAEAEVKFTVGGGHGSGISTTELLEVLGRRLETVGGERVTGSPWRY